MTIAEIEHAELIAKFLGYKVEDTPGGDVGMYYQNAQGDWIYSRSIYDTYYHSHWDWLMPVVEKIESIKPDGLNVVYGVQIDSNYCLIHKDGEVPITEHQSDTKFDATIRAVIDFIRWHNNEEGE
ncbi:hypothetical protein ACFS5N_16380 [Mucilaginibacter ximonensis]|uniref:Phage ABA sandwich domain-containing protein n=1 Tax=Mucilaginibacter ximonensis TaxID=538021 RepID=A0ABW5YFL3_9SPHI